MAIPVHVQKTIVFILMVLVVTQLISLLVLVVHWSCKRNLQVVPKQQEICFAKGSLVLPDQSESDLDGLTPIFDEEKNATTYCSSTSEILSRVVNKTVKERYNNDANPELHERMQKKCNTNNSGTEVAHLHEIASYATPVEGKPTKIYWKHENLNTSSLEHLKEDGTIHVKRTGLYFISSQLTLWVDHNTDSTDVAIGDDVVHHYVQIISGGVEKVLLESTMSECEIIGEESQKTSKIEAVFQLRDNDRIFVASSHPYKLVCANLKNHLIIYKL